MPSAPESSYRQANERLNSYLADKAGMSVDEKAALKDANQVFERTKKTSDIYFDSAAKKTPGSMDGNKLSNALADVFVNPAREKATQATLSLGKAAAEKAMSRLDRNFGTGKYGDLSPFQADQLRAKLQTIAGMDPKDQSAYVYA